MGFGPIRALVLDVNLAVHGLDVVVTRPAPDDTPIDTRGIWLTFLTEDVPTVADFQRRNVRRVMVLSRSAVPTIPHKTIVWAPERMGGVMQRWRSDGPERIEGDNVQVLLISDPEIAEP